MGKVIVIEPGHGLRNGEWGRPLIDCREKTVKIVSNSMKPHIKDRAINFYREDIGVLELSFLIKKQLEELGHTVLLTRDDDNSSEVKISKDSNNDWKLTHWKKHNWIVDFTNKNQADIFISLHTNAHSSSLATGSRVFWHTAPNGVTLAEYLADSLKISLDLKLNKVMRRKYSVLNNNCNGRSVLLEVLFHTNKNDIQWLLEEPKKQVVATAISSAINTYSLTF